MIVVADTNIPLVSSVLQSHDVVSVQASEITNSLLQKTGANAVLVRSITGVTSELLSGTDVTFVGSATAGMDHIEPSLQRHPDVRVVGAPGCNANAVAEYVVIWLNHLNISRTSTIGIIGFGNVGQRVARYALQRGHRVVVNDPPLADLEYQFPDLVQHCSLDELLSISDIVTVHTPLTEDGVYSTRHLLHDERINVLRHGSLLINAARGGIIDEHAVCNRVSQGALHCVLDVYDHEPTPSVDTINAIDHCTPHIAGYSEAAKYQGARMILKALRQHFSLDISIPELAGLTTRTSSVDEDARLIVDHPFRTAYLAAPNAYTFEESRRLTPLRSEHLQPPTWDELNGNCT